MLLGWGAMLLWLTRGEAHGAGYGGAARTAAKGRWVAGCQGAGRCKGGGRLQAGCRAWAVWRRRYGGSGAGEVWRRAAKRAAALLGKALGEGVVPGPRRCGRCGCRRQPRRRWPAGRRWRGASCSRAAAAVYTALKSTIGVGAAQHLGADLQAPARAGDRILEDPEQPHPPAPRAAAWGSRTPARR